MNVKGLEGLTGKFRKADIMNPLKGNKFKLDIGVKF